MTPRVDLLFEHSQCGMLVQARRYHVNRSEQSAWQVQGLVDYGSTLDTLRSESEVIGQVEAGGLRVVRIFRQMQGDAAPRRIVRLVAELAGA